METITPERWKRGAGYSHAVKAEGRLILAGVLPWDPETQEIRTREFTEQWASALDNVAALLGAAGLTPQQVVLLRIFVTDLDAYRAAGAGLGMAWRRVFGQHFPAITLVEVSRLVSDGAMLEIEGEAIC